MAYTIITEFTDEKEIRSSSERTNVIYANRFFTEEDIGIWLELDSRVYQIVKKDGELRFRTITDSGDVFPRFLIADKLVECDPPELHSADEGEVNNETRH